MERETKTCVIMELSSIVNLTDAMNEDGWQFQKAEQSGGGAISVLFTREIDTRSAFEWLCDELNENAADMINEDGDRYISANDAFEAVRQAQQRHEAEQDGCTELAHDLSNALSVNEGKLQTAREALEVITGDLSVSITLNYMRNIAIPGDCAPQDRYSYIARHALDKIGGAS